VENIPMARQSSVQNSIESSEVQLLGRTPPLAREHSIREPRPLDRARRAIALVLVALLPWSSGCITSYLWKTDDPDGTSDDTGLETTGRVVLTPVTVATDIATLLIVLWIWAKLNDLKRDDC
jgi:hypothetical protein